MQIRKVKKWKYFESLLSVQNAIMNIFYLPNTFSNVQSLNPGVEMCIKCIFFHAKTIEFFSAKTMEFSLPKVSTRERTISIKPKEQMNTHRLAGNDHFNILWANFVITRISARVCSRSARWLCYIFPSNEWNTQRESRICIKAWRFMYALIERESLQLDVPNTSWSLEMLPKIFHVFILVLFTLVFIDENDLFNAKRNQKIKLWTRANENFLLTKHFFHRKKFESCPWNMLKMTTHTMRNVKRQRPYLVLWLKNV